MSEDTNLSLFERAGALMNSITAGEASELNRLARENDLETMEFFVRRLEALYGPKNIEVIYSPSLDKITVRRGLRGSERHTGHDIELGNEAYEPENGAYCINCEEWFINEV